MSKVYALQKLRGQDYSYLIFAVSHVSPTESLAEIERDLAGTAESRVLFDLLLSNGNAFNRFLSAKFDGQHFELASFMVVSERLAEIGSLAMKFYQSHPELVDSSILSKAAKFLLRKGVLPVRASGQEATQFSSSVLIDRKGGGSAGRS